MNEELKTRTPPLPGFETYVVEETHGRLQIKDLPAAYHPTNRLCQAGAGELSTIEVLAALLGVSDGMEVAVELLVRFESLSGLVRASVTELQEIAGIGRARATQLKAALELGRRAMVPDDDRPRITGPKDAAELLMPEMRHLKQEEFRVLLLNTKNRLIRIVPVYRGSLHTAVIRVTEVFHDAIRESAAAILVAHNHPSGDETPSPEDVKITREIVDAGKLLDIEVLDHLVVGHGSWISLREKGLGFS